MAETEYVSIEEVERVCKDLGISNWAANPPKTVSAQEAEVILKAMAVEGMDIPVETMRVGLEVELEHGTMFADANVTNNHPILTGKIVLAHLKETMDYYDRLDVAEIEGDMLKAAVAGNTEKLRKLYAKLLAAKGNLAQAEADAMKS